MKTKKNFEEPVLDVIKFETTDIITTSIPPIEPTIEPTTPGFDVQA